MYAYSSSGCYDEMFDADGCPRQSVLADQLNKLTHEDLVRRQKAAEDQLFERGITFAVYGDDAGIEKVWPFDILPRIVASDEWHRLELELRQRIHALNLFIDDVYNDQKILRDGVVPEYLIQTASSFRKECIGHRPPRGVWTHVTGTDLVRDRDGQFYVLEDNMRCPSGVSYVIENRDILKRSLPEVF